MEINAKIFSISDSAKKLPKVLTKNIKKNRLSPILETFNNAGLDLYFFLIQIRLKQSIEKSKEKNSSFIKVSSESTFPPHI